VPPVGFEPTILADERSQTHASDRVATGINLTLRPLNTTALRRFKTSGIKHPTMLFHVPDDRILHASAKT